MVTSYLGSRLKIIRNLPNDTHLITITDPLNRQLYFNNTNDNNVVINIIYKDKKFKSSRRLKKISFIMNLKKS